MVSAHTWLIYVVSECAFTMWYSHMCWGLLWEWSLHVCGRSYIYNCVCTLLCKVFSLVYGWSWCVFAHFLCVHILVFVVAAQMCNRAYMCYVPVCTCVCRSW